LSPIEKAYLHTDKDWYTPNETIWFKGYVTVENQLTELSKVMYVDLLNSKDSVVIKTMWKLNKNSFKGDIVQPENWTYFNAEAKIYADFPFHQLYTGTIPILEKWIGQLLEVANDGDFNVLLMKFNRKGSYIACQQTPSLNLNPNYSTYISPTYGPWIIQDFESFWNANSKAIEKICETGRRGKL
jgi:hypothetical protein